MITTGGAAVGRKKMQPRRKQERRTGDRGNAGLEVSRE